MKVSIITVCLNSAETIEETIRSILSQDYKDIEYIVVDGGSTDGTLDVLATYRSRIHRCISEPDGGIYHAMNKGIKLSTGDIVGFLNSNDTYTGQCVIRRIVQAIQTNNTDCCYGDLEYVARNNSERIVRMWKSQPYRHGLFEKGWHPPHPTFFAKKDILNKHGYFNPSYNISADYELMLRLLKKHGIKSCYIPSVLVKMRMGGNSSKNLWRILKANVQCYQAWRQNGLNISPFIALRKPMSKLRQFIRKA